MDADVLALSRRRLIFEHISKFPGTYLREMEKDLDVSVGDLQYHLLQLEKSGIIFSHEEANRKRYFAADKVRYSDREILAVVKLRTSRRIVMFLLGNPDSTFREILAQFDFTKGALSFHLKRLLKRGIILKGKREKENIYKVADEDKVGAVLVTYQTSLMDEALDGFLDTWTKIG